MSSISFNLVAEKFKQKQREALWPDDPVMWSLDHGLFLWSKQKEVARSVVEHPKTLVVTGNGVGKSRLSAMLTTWWVATHPLDDTTVVTTATNWKQVVNVLWKEIPRVKAAADVEGRITADAQWKIGDRKDPVAFGLKPDDKDESGFQGIHDRYVLVVIDEAGGVSKEIFTAADAVTTNEHARILAIANPNDPSSYMAEVFRKESKLPVEERSWNIIQFGAFDSPNFTGEEVPEEVASRLVQVDWVKARRREWGEDDPRYKARVLGEFPDISDTGLFNMGRVMQSMVMHDEFEYNPQTRKRLGVDVARYGSDYSVLSTYQDGYVEILGKYKDKSGPELARIIGDAVSADNTIKEIRIDGVGVGVSVLDNVAAYISPEILVYDIRGNGASPDNTKWFNWRAASYDQVAKGIALGKISLPNDDELYEEIASIDYTYRGSALLLDSKEKMRKDGKHSPDILDSIVYAAQDIDDLSNHEQKEDVIDLMEMMDDTLIIDEWGNEPWMIFPA